MELNAYPRQRLLQSHLTQELGPRKRLHLAALSGS